MNRVMDVVESCKRLSTSELDVSKSKVGNRSRSKITLQQKANTIKKNTNNITTDRHKNLSIVLIFYSSGLFSFEITSRRRI